MQLHVGEFCEKNASALIRWCISPKEIARIKQMCGIPLLVLSIGTVEENGSFAKEENRLVVPLTDMAVYVYFRNAGKHLILAGVINNGNVDPDERSKIASIHSRYAGFDVFQRSVIESKCTDWQKCEYEPKLYERYILEDFQASLSVDVDEKLFATKPFDWKLVGYWFETKPLNQCLHRKRRFLAYFLTIFVLPCMYLFRLVYDVFLANFLLGYRHVNWRWFLNPFNNEFKKDLSQCYFSWW